jgi:predicted phosphoadenosine phosphosulfate sulfurtransferase
MRLTQAYNNTLNVLEATKKRIEFIFDNFEEIHCSISGGKDSTVLSHLCLLEAKRRNRRVGIFFLDEEVVYQSTIEMVTYIIENMMPGHTIPLWLQIEFNLTNATSLTETQFIPWEAGKSKIWMRPKKSYSIKFAPWDRSKEIIADKNKGFGFYDVFYNFEKCYENTAFLVGLRGTESPNRWRTVSKNPAYIGGENVYWATTKGKNFSIYPLYDWNFHDIWKYIFDNNLSYHKIYDYQFRKGYPINEMRISSLIHEKSFKSICDLPEFEPDTYNRLIKRAKGIILAQETGKKAKLFKARKLPKNYKSWMTYRDFLLDTHPDEKGKEILAKRFSKHLDNEYVARQQVRQLVLNDYENNLPVDNQIDPREKLIQYYMENL